MQLMPWRQGIHQNSRNLLLSKTNNSCCRGRTKLLLRTNNCCRRRRKIVFVEDEHMLLPRTNNLCPHTNPHPSEAIGAFALKLVQFDISYVCMRERVCNAVWIFSHLPTSAHTDRMRHRSHDLRRLTVSMPLVLGSGTCPSDALAQQNADTADWAQGNGFGVSTHGSHNGLGTLRHWMSLQHTPCQ